MMNLFIMMYLIGIGVVIGYLLSECNRRRDKKWRTNAMKKKTKKYSKK